MTSGPRLRRFDDWLLRNPWPGLLILGLVSGLLYEIASRLPYITPYDIGPTWIDARVPYLWWTIPWYMTYYLVLPTFAWLNQHTPPFPLLWRRACAYIVCNLTITIIVPTRVHPLGPRAATRHVGALGGGLRYPACSHSQRARGPSLLPVAMFSQIRWQQDVGVRGVDRHICNHNFNDQAALRLGLAGRRRLGLRDCWAARQGQ